MLELADQFLEAQGGASLAKTKDGPTMEEKGKYEKGGSGRAPPPRCYICNRGNHPPHLCRYKRPAADTAIVCFKCGKERHRHTTAGQGRITHFKRLASMRLGKPTRIPYTTGISS
ncbi:hypothetical protein MTO96_032571 [Rhipicephalus appendiculatus]